MFLHNKSNRHTFLLLTHLILTFFLQHKSNIRTFQTQLIFSTTNMKLTITFSSNIHLFFYNDCLTGNPFASNIQIFLQAKANTHRVLLLIHFYIIKQTSIFL